VKRWSGESGSSASAGLGVDKCAAAKEAVRMPAEMVGVGRALESVYYDGALSAKHERLVAIDTAPCCG